MNRHVNNIIYIYLTTFAVFVKLIYYTKGMLKRSQLSQITIQSKSSN